MKREFANEKETDINVREKNFTIQITLYLKKQRKIQYFTTILPEKSRSSMAIKIKSLCRLTLELSRTEV